MSGFGGGFGGVQGGAGKAEPKERDILSNPTPSGFETYGAGGKYNNVPNGGTKNGFYARTDYNNFRSTVTYSPTGDVSTPVSVYLNRNRGFMAISASIGLKSATTTGLYATEFVELNMSSPIFNTYANLNEQVNPYTIQIDTAPNFRFSWSFEVTTANTFNQFSVIPQEFFPFMNFQNFAATSSGGYTVMPKYSPTATIRAGVSGVTTGQVSSFITLRVEHKRMSNLTPVEVYG